MVDIVASIHRWQFHGHQTEKLYQVFTHLGAQSASLFVVTGTVFNPNCLGDGYHELVTYRVAVANSCHRRRGYALRACDRESWYTAASCRRVSDALDTRGCEHDGSRGRDHDW